MFDMFPVLVTTYSLEEMLFTVLSAIKLVFCRRLTRYFKET